VRGYYSFQRFSLMFLLLVQMNVCFSFLSMYGTLFFLATVLGRFF